MTQSSILLTILAAVPVMHLFRACILIFILGDGYTELHKISILEHYILKENNV